jgi:hypothetical protein
MKDTKTNKYEGLIKRSREGFAERSNDDTEYIIEFRTFIISSIDVVPNDAMNSLKSIIEKYHTSGSNLWMKRMVVQVL